MRYFGPCIAAVAALTLPVQASATAAEPAQKAMPGSSAAQAPAGRDVTDLSEGWRFRFGASPDTVTGAEFDDSGWQQVTVPHTWNSLGEYALKRSPDANNAQGAGWYRLAYAAPASAVNARHYLDFAAVGKIADVWVNGAHVGTHKGAFGRFRFDVTDVWRPGQTNLIVVRADNSAPKPDNASGNVIPLAGDFFVQGGIYRNVALITTGEVGIDLLDHGGPGVYASATDVTADSASITVLTRLRNAGKAQRKFDAIVTVHDAQGKAVAGTTTKVKAKAGASEVVQTLALPNPHLWNGTSDPYLYSVKIMLVDGKGVIDSVTQPLGVRDFRFEADKGLFLNGTHVKLKGVSRHQDRAGRGWALTRADHAEDMALIRELGANTVRHAHYQHADAWSEEADKAGMVVWAELPFVTTPSLSGGEGTSELWENAESQLVELIRQNFNHPSIMMWSVGNEVDAAKGFGIQGEAPRPLALLKHLNAIARREDPTRPTTFADCCEDVGLMETAGDKLAGTTDLIGYNRYFGWYMPGQLDARRQFGAALDKLHTKHPTLPISISEYGAGGAFGQHSDNIRSGYVNMMGRPQPEEFQSFVQEQTWPAIAERDFVFASWVWNMFDFVSDMREEGDSIDLNTKGLVSFDRKTRKDAFYYYKAAWNPQQSIQLAGKRYVDRAYGVMDVKAYTNAKTASLAINGAAIGTVDCPNFTCEWKGVKLAPGANRAEVRSGDLADTTVWNGPDSPRTGIHIDAGNLAGSMIGGVRFGSDNFVTGGTTRILNLGGFGKMRMPRRDVTASQPDLFAYWREGKEFAYAVPVPNGRWTITIRTFDPGAGPKLPPSAAIFGAGSGKPAGKLTVAANGKAVISGLDVAKAAGGELKELVRSFPVTVRDGMLRLDFSGTDGNAVVAAIEIAK